MTSPVHGSRASCFDPDPRHGRSAPPEPHRDSTAAASPEPHRGSSAPASPEPPGPPGCAFEAPSCSDVGEQERPATRAVEALRERGLRFCREADSVVEGFLCDEPVVVSNACRKPGNAFDAYVCDEPRMHSLQKSVLRETLSVLKGLLLELLRR